MRINETVTTYDLAEALQGEQGTFFAQRAGQDSLITCERGHSITSFRPIGVAEPVAALPGTNQPYSLTKVSDQILEGSWEERQGSRSREGAGTRN